jgi:hypothetical protein
MSSSTAAWTMLSSNLPFWWNASESIRDAEKVTDANLPQIEVRLQGIARRRAMAVNHKARPQSVP